MILPNIRLFLLAYSANYFISTIIIYKNYNASLGKSIDNFPSKITMNCDRKFESTIKIKRYVIFHG